MNDILTQMLDAGYEITFTRSPDGYVAAVGDDDGIAVTPEVALLAAAPGCECGHAGGKHDEVSPDVDGLRGGRMCGRDDCMCLAYRPAL